MEGVGLHAAPVPPGGNPQLHHLEHGEQHHNPSFTHRFDEQRCDGGGSPDPRKPSSKAVAGGSSKGMNQKKAKQQEEGEALDYSAEETKKQHMKKFVTIMVPTMVSNILWFSITAVAQMYIGHRMGAVALAQTAVGVSVFNALGLATGFGMCAALDTLVSQAFGRDADSNEMAELMQRGMLVNCGMWAMTTIAYIASEPILLKVFGEELGSGGYEFVKWSPLMLWPVLQLQALFKSLQAVNIAEYPFYVNLFGAIINPVYHYFFAYSLFGCVMSMALTFWSMLAMGVYLCKRSYDKGGGAKMVLAKGDWPCKNLASPALLKEYFVVGIPSLLSLIAEWWAFELLQVVAAQVSTHAVAVFGVIMSIVVFAFSSPLGISIASSVTIGNSLGANEPEIAKWFAKLGMMIDQTLTVVVCVVMVLYARTLAVAYTDDASVLDVVEQLSWLMALFHYCDSTQFTLQGIFRGAGRQADGAKVVLFSLWIFGVPLPYVFAIHFEMGVKGIVLGLCTGIAIEIPLLIFFLNKWDWEAIATQAARAELEEEEKCFPGQRTEELPRMLPAVGEEDLSSAVKVTAVVPVKDK